MSALGGKADLDQPLPTNLDLWLVQAEHHRGKAAGLYEDRLRVTGGPSDADLLKGIEALLGKEVA